MESYPEIPEVQVRRLFEAVDMNHNGEVEYNSFLAATYSAQQALTNPHPNPNPNPNANPNPNPNRNPNPNPSQVQQGLRLVVARRGHLRDARRLPALLRRALPYP